MTDSSLRQGRTWRLRGATFLFRSLTFRVIAFSTLWAVVTLIVIAAILAAIHLNHNRIGFSESQWTSTHADDFWRRFLCMMFAMRKT